MTLARRRTARAAPRPKKILILGGTAFLGPALVAAARAHGHTLTLFNRGKTNPGRFPDLEQLHGDRDGHLEALAGRKWDVVIDDSGYVPRLVKDSATLLAPNVGHYVFVSTISVYADLGKPVDEDAPVATLEEPTEKVGPRKLRRAQGAVRRGGEGGAARPRHRRAARAHRRPRRSDRSLHLLARAPARAAARCWRRATPTDPVAYIDVRDLGQLDRRGAWSSGASSAPSTRSARPSTLGIGAMLEGCAKGVGGDAHAHLGRRRRSSTSRACSPGPTCRCGSRPSTTASTRASSAARARSRRG